jgi:hypothetical protein
MIFKSHVVTKGNSLKYKSSFLSISCYSNHAIFTFLLNVIYYNFRLFTGRLLTSSTILCTMYGPTKNAHARENTTPHWFFKATDLGPRREKIYWICFHIYLQQTYTTPSLASYHTANAHSSCPWQNSLHCGIFRL